MTETTVQYDAAVNHLLGLMVILAKTPGSGAIATLPPSIWTKTKDPTCLGMAWRSQS